jgi:hypothetical protein
MSDINVPDRKLEVPRTLTGGSIRTHCRSAIWFVYAGRWRLYGLNPTAASVRAYFKRGSQVGVAGVNLKTI